MGTVTLSSFGRNKEQAYAFAWALIQENENALVIRKGGLWFVQHATSIH